jgi:hypothetical protein
MKGLKVIRDEEPGEFKLQIKLLFVLGLVLTAVSIYMFCVRFA